MSKILFVDDEPEFVRPQISALEGMGHTVIFRSDASSAIAVLESEHVDLMILDLIMPPYNGDRSEEQVAQSDDELIETGERLYSQIREGLSLSIPIVFLTVIRDPEIRNKISRRERKIGQRPHFLTKPVSSSAVVDEVEKVIKESEITLN